MPVFDTLKRSLLGDTATPRTYICGDCGADFSLVEVPDAGTLECRYCGGTDVSLRGA